MMPKPLAIILSVSELECDYCKRAVKQGFTVRFADGTLGLCARDMQKQVVMRAALQARLDPDDDAADLLSMMRGANGALTD